MRYASHTKLCSHATLLLLAFAAGGCSYIDVRDGEVGVVLTPTGIRDKLYHEGSWGIGIYDTPTVYNARSQGRDEHLDVLAANGLRIVLDTSIRFHIVADEVLALDRELGPGYYEVLLGPTLRSQARRVVGRYDPEAIYSSQREVIERQIREGLEAAIKGRHIVLEAVLIRNVTLPERIEQAINSKLAAEQASLQMKWVIEQAKQEEDKRLIQSKAEAERLRIGSLAAADAKRTEAQGIDDYERIIQQHMNALALKWQQLEVLKGLSTSPNAKLIFMGGEGKGMGTLLDLK